MRLDDGLINNTDNPHVQNLEADGQTDGICPPGYVQAHHAARVAEQR